MEYVEWLGDGRDSDASRNMSREPGREGTEASEAWREAGLDIVGVGAPRRRRDCCWLLACLGVRWEVCRPGAASVVVRRFGPPRASLASMSGVSQSKLERRCVSSMSDMLGSSHFSFLTGHSPELSGGWLDGY